MIVYQSMPSFIAPVNHGAELPIPQPPTTHAISSTSSEDRKMTMLILRLTLSEDPYFPNQD